MELQELEAAWKTLDARVSQQAVELKQLRSKHLLSRVSLGQWKQLAIGLVFVLWGGAYWADHLGTPHLVAYGLAAHAYGIAIMATAIVLLVAVSRVDHTLPVADVQQRLLELRRARIRSERILWLFGAVMWVPLLMMGVRGFLHLDVWLLDPSYVLWNLAVGAALAVIAALVMWRKPAWFAKSAMQGPLAEIDRQLADLHDLRA